MLASNFVFHRNLLRLGDQSRWISNFRRLFGISGFFKLLAVEVVKNAIPIAIGSILLGIRGHANVGAAFAGFVLVLGRLWPALYGFRGSNAVFAMIAAAFWFGERTTVIAYIGCALILAGVVIAEKFKRNPANQ